MMSQNLDLEKPLMKMRTHSMLDCQVRSQSSIGIDQKSAVALGTL